MITALLAAIACSTKPEDSSNGGDSADTDTTTQTVYTDRGPDCETPANDAARRTTVTVPGECATLQYAIETVACTDGYIEMESGRMIPASADFAAAGTCAAYANLIIGSSGAGPAYLHPTNYDDAVMLDIQGGHSILIDNAFLEGFGAATLVNIDGGASVEIDYSVFHDMQVGASVMDGAYVGTGNVYELVYGQAIAAGDGADVTASDFTVYGQVPSDGPMISVAGTAEVLLMGGTIAGSETLADVVSIDADYARVYDLFLFDNVTDGYVLNVVGGDPVDERDIEIDNQVYSNVIVNNVAGPGGVARFDATGEMTVANNTFANNDPDSDGFNTVIDLTDTAGDGVTTFTNNFVGYHDGLASEEILAGFGDAHVDASYNTFAGNGSAPIPQDDEFTNEECDPFENGELLDMFVYDELYVNASEYAHEEGDACLDSTGNPESKFTNPDENVSDRGAFGGKYLEGLEEQAAAIDAYDWFGASETE